jgi:hypothetical protein
MASERAARTHRGIHELHWSYLRGLLPAVAGGPVAPSDLAMAAGGGRCRGHRDGADVAAPSESEPMVSDERCMTFTARTSGVGVVRSLARCAFSLLTNRARPVINRGVNGRTFEPGTLRQTDVAGAQS